MSQRVNHRISLLTACDVRLNWYWTPRVHETSYEEFKSLFDQLLGLKMEEQLRRELRDETTTCAERWEKQTYEVDEQVCSFAFVTA